jgi:hypothetical protein
MKEEKMKKNEYKEKKKDKDVYEKRKKIYMSLQK